MMRRLCTVVVVAAFALVAAGGTAEAKLCANTFGGDLINATGVRCSKARDVVRTWAVRYRRDGDATRRVRRFRCRGRNDPIEGLIVRCRRPDGARIQFFANVPR